ncbi:hypothetical protein MLD38_012844 [Melastoma candidum]|nr:hypothetical protein MLD38_012844 [Melastoma candidum]
MGLHRARKPVTLSLSPVPLSFSLSQIHHGQDRSRFEEYPDPNTESYRKSTVSEGSIALMLESSLDENTRFGGWMEMNNLDPGHIQWSVNLSDDSKDELGWGLSLGGTNGSPRSENRFQAESHVKINIGNRLELRPGVVHVMDGNARITAFMLRSHWSF